MKIERLIGIIAILQQQKKVTAPFLAEKFEVSRRTINRDIEDICRAGLPVVTTQGKNGGISFMEGFSLDTAVFTQQELTAVFTGLKTLDSISRVANTDGIARKFGGNYAAGLSDGMVIDLASFYKEDLADKIDLLKSAIRECRCVAFRYCYRKGESQKKIEPYQIVFKWSDWYVYGFCLEHKGFRMYKLRRLWELTVTGERFGPRSLPEETERFGSHMADDYYVAAIYDASAKYKLVEERGPASFVVAEDGKLHARWGFGSMEDALSWFLGFGSQVTVTDPPEMVERMQGVLTEALRRYGGI